MVLTRVLEYRDDALIYTWRLSEWLYSLVTFPSILDVGTNVPPSSMNLGLLDWRWIHRRLGFGTIRRLVGSGKTGRRDGKKNGNGGERRDERDGFMCFVGCRG